MKKWLWIELIILAVVALVAVGLYLFLPMFLVEPPPVIPAAAATQRTESVAPLEQKLGVTWLYFGQDRPITAHSAFVYDCQEKTVLRQIGDMNGKIYPASVTKIFTAYCMLEIFQPDQQITVGDALSLVPWDSSIAGLQKGDVLTVKKLVQGMMLPSGNDAACVLAVAAGRTIAADPALNPAAAVDVFMERVNSRLKELGITNTHFTTPDGYHDPEHYTTMTDLIAMATLALSNPTIAESAAQTEVATGLKLVPQWRNSNALLHPQSPVYCPYADGLKTGSHTEAGKCLISSFTIRGKQYIVGVFGSVEHMDRFVETLDILNQALGVAEGRIPVDGELTTQYNKN